MHILPSLRELEGRFGRELVVVGVHAGKFIAERVTENIRQAMLRLGVNHPVLNDRQYRTWRAYAVNAWPTLVLVDARGYILGQQAGELTSDQLAPAIQGAIEAAEREGVLDHTALELPPDTPPATPLLFPQKVALDAGGERLAIADTAHERIVLARLASNGRSARLESIVGSGQAGLMDGTGGEARFRGPHGVAFAADGSRLYVADTDNHAIRAVDVASGSVSTLAGDGSQSRRWPPVGGVGAQVALNSPWDVLEHAGTLYIAMAGSHQLWKLDPGTGRAQPWVGSGAEALHDGSARSAALAQPSGLARSGDRLWFADSESSAIRSVDLNGDTSTIVGTGLFDFGDRDGTGDDVRLQHPLGIAWADGRLLVADTYNSVLKWIEPATRSATRWEPEVKDGLWEPGGVAVAGARVVVADTNHHRVLAGDLADRTLWELEVENLQAPGA